MNCRQAEHCLCAESDGALTHEQRAALASHLSNCTSCRQLQRQLAATLTSWQGDTLAVRVPDAELEWRKVRREIDAAPSARWLAWLALPVAAAAALAIAFYVEPASHAPEPAATTIAATPAPAVGAPSIASTVVYVDDKSGWTFVWEPDNGGTHI